MAKKKKTGKEYGARVLNFVLVFASITVAEIFLNAVFSGIELKIIFNIGQMMAINTLACSLVGVIWGAVAYKNKLDIKKEPPDEQA